LGALASRHQLERRRHAKGRPRTDSQRPYRSIRHPIYTGILLAFLGTAVALGEVRGLLAVAIAWLSFYTKARREESFLTQEFGASFAEHSERTGMFLPRS